MTFSYHSLILCRKFLCGSYLVVSTSSRYSPLFTPRFKHERTKSIMMSMVNISNLESNSLQNNFKDRECFLSDNRYSEFNLSRTSHKKTSFLGDAK